MITTLAVHDPTRFAAIAQWDVRDGLVAFVERLSRDALEQFRHEQTLYVLGGLKQPPTLPPILAGQSTASQSPVAQPQQQLAQHAAQPIAAHEVVDHV